MVLSFLVIKPFLMSILVGALLAYIFYPIYQFLLKGVKNKTASALLLSFFVFLLLVVPAVFAVEMLIKESYIIYLVMKQKLAVGLFESCNHSLCENIKSLLQDESVAAQIKEVIKTITSWVIQKSSDLLIKLPRLILNIFVMFFTMFFFTRDGEALLAKINSFFSAHHQKKYTYILTRLKEILHGVVFGYLLVAALQGALGALGFYFFGVSSPLFWGMVMAILALIPFLGTGVIWVPASLYLIFNGLFQDSNIILLKGIGLFVYSLVFVASIDNIIRPKIIGDRAKVHMFVVMIGIFGGLLIFGPLGVILGPVVLSLAVELIEVYLGNKVHD